MIYLVDESLSDVSHSRFMMDIIKQHTSQPIELLSVGTTIGDIVFILEKLLHCVTPQDIILCPWAIAGNPRIDSYFEELADLCWVITAAGNTSESIDNWTPARVHNVITVGCLNKSGNKASLSNFSDTKQLEWVTGTNYSVGWKISSGTSISAALYAAFLSEAIVAKDITVVNTLIKQEADKGMHELCWK